MADTPVLEVRGAVRKYGATIALSSLDITVEAGELLVLLGPSGCGKTTLLRAIAGLDLLDEGEMLLRGKPISHLGAQERNVAMVFQDGGLFPHLTVRENVAVALRRTGARWREAGRSAEVDRALETVGIAKLAERRPVQLSGGQRQRVGIARALAATPELLLMDEPFANLDADLRLDLRRELRRLRLEREVPETVFVTHDQTEALSLADRIAVIFDGNLEQLATPVELLARPATLRVARFLGVPRINVLPVVGDVILAVRPTDFVPAAEGDALTLPGTVVAAEPFAGGTLVTVRVPSGGELEVTLASRRPFTLGGELRAEVPIEAMHAFDAVTGARRDDVHRDAIRAAWEVFCNLAPDGPASPASP